MDWNEAKSDYVTDTNITYEQIAQKYGVSLTAVAAHSKKEGWREERENLLQKTYKKTIMSVANKRAQRTRRLNTAADKVLKYVEAVMRSVLDGEISITTKELREITGALKDIKDIQDIRSDVSLREHEARVKALEARAAAEAAMLETDEDDTGVIVLSDVDAPEVGSVSASGEEGEDG